MVNVVLARLRQRATWLAIATLLGLLGVQLAPESWERVVSAGMTLSDIVALLLPLLGQ
ncbi:hypothetical protein [Teichococcus rhizosphaerae]|uniref:hypothetical protein n=1 Tax=Teichococcus rhizosphaerae TaxID=1335062 RepID=UPI00159B93B6|nr:hypothetical protein [Pseudoroseomonas rhizosphaerae]